MAGKIYLVGAGPGDPELLTRKAWRVLQSADVVLHDDLVSREILGTLPAGTRIVSVGKRCGMRKLLQSDVNDQMVSLARAGEIVARLKSGDPLLFGRAGEEMEALRRADIDFEVIPGVTAALGAAASARIPLTDRRHASRVVFLTAQRAAGTGLVGDQNAAGSLADDTTYVIYMPGSNYEDLAAQLGAIGIGVETPCIVISRATTPDETMYCTTLAGLPQGPVAAAPSLLIVGSVVGSVAEEKAVAQDGKLAGILCPEVLSLAMQHPFHEPGEDRCRTIE